MFIANGEKKKVGRSLVMFVKLDRSCLVGNDGCVCMWCVCMWYVLMWCVCMMWCVYMYVVCVYQCVPVWSPRSNF